MTVTKERAMQMFDRDLEILMDDLRGMQTHYQIEDWEAFVFLRKPDCPESYVVKYAAANDEFAKQIVQLHSAPTPPTATAAEPTHDQVVQAITDIQEARDSHEQWATHLRQPHTFECQGCEDHAAHIGDAEYHDEWIAKYDNVIYVLAHAPFTAVAATSGAREAAEEIVDELFQHATQLTATIAGDPVGIASYSPNYVIEKVVAIISRHFSSAVTVEEQKCTCCGELNCECGPFVAPNSKVVDDPCRICGKCINHCPHQ